MIEAILLLRWVSIILWVAVALVLAPSLWCVVRKRPRRLDAMWTLWLGMAALSIVSRAHWIVRPDPVASSPMLDQQILFVLQIFYLLLGCSVIGARYAYGRD